LERLEARTGTPGKATPVRFVPYQSEEAARRLGRAYRPGRPEVAFFIHEDGTVSRGLDEFLPLVPGLPGGRVLQRLMRIRVIRPLATWLYRLVARNRYRWFGEVK
ncbi:MAG: thiol-disulfide oxidoreductase DCC family protein, partial [Nitrospirales bacterium]